MRFYTVIQISLALFVTVYGMKNKERAIAESSSRGIAKVDKVEEVWHDYALTNLYERDPKYTRMIFSSERNPSFHDPFKNWMPIKYNVWMLDTGERWPYEKIPDYSDDAYVFLNPADFYPGELQRKLKALKDRYEVEKTISKEEYEREVMNLELLEQAMKIISVPSNLCGALRVAGYQHVYYHNRMDPAEVERRKENNLLPILYSQNDVYYFHFPWMHPTENAGKELDTAEAAQDTD